MRPHMVWQFEYRSVLNILSLVLALAFSAVLLYAATESKNICIGIVTIAFFIYTIYLGLRIKNKRVILVGEKIIFCSLWNKKTEYDIKNITKIAVANQLRTKYIKIYFGDKKVIVRRDIKNYDAFLKLICDQLHITGYTRSGVSEFVIK